MKRDTIVICGFPGIGKTTFFKQSHGLDVMDIDRNDYMWLLKNSIVNPEFSKEYSEAIKDFMGLYDILLVSPFKAIRTMLVKEDIDFTLIYPKRNRKEEMIKLYISMGYESEFIEFIKDEWDNLIDDMINQEHCTHIELYPEQFLDIVHVV